MKNGQVVEGSLWSVRPGTAFWNAPPRRWLSQHREEATHDFAQATAQTLVVVVALGWNTQKQLEEVQVMSPFWSLGFTWVAAVCLVDA